MEPGRRAPVFPLMSKKANPQGKGVSPLLAVIEQQDTAVAAARPKAAPQVATELFTAVFILESDFAFQPTVGRPHWLYRKQGRFRLSLTPPDAWDPCIAGQFIGECRLHQDMSWTLELSEAATGDTALQDELAGRRQRFERELENAETLGGALPRFRGDLGFYRRVYAYALSRSLEASMRQTDISRLPYRDALALPSDS